MYLIFILFFLRPTTISPFTFFNVSAETNNNNSPELWMIPTVLLSLVVVVGVIAAIAMLYKCKYHNMNK